MLVVTFYSFLGKTKLKPQSEEDIKYKQQLKNNQFTESTKLVSSMPHVVLGSISSNGILKTHQRESASSGMA